MSTISDPDYRLPLPTPAQVKSLADGNEAAVSPAITASLAELANANAGGNAATIEAVADVVTRKFTIATVSNEPSECGRDYFNIYDAYFAVNRLPEGASNEHAMEALTVALAVVIKDAAKAETETCGVTPIEFGILRQALAVVIEILSETQITNQ